MVIEFHKKGERSPLLVTNGSTQLRTIRIRNDLNRTRSIYDTNEHEVNSKWEYIDDVVCFSTRREVLLNVTAKGKYIEQIVPSVLGESYLSSFWLLCYRNDVYFILNALVKFFDWRHRRTVRRNACLSRNCVPSFSIQKRRCNILLFSFLILLSV